jgi:molybdenum cofactor biosynthesis protein MoaC
MAVEMNYAEIRSAAESAGGVSGPARTALASGRVLIGEIAFAAIKEGKIKRGDPLSIAQITGILASKKTADHFPFCRPNAVTDLVVDCVLDESDFSVKVQAFAKANGNVGVQMEALFAVTTACLEIFEMCKSLNPGITITDICVDSKTGGLSGAFRKN